MNIEMPKLSDTMTEGKLVKWRKAVGDKVEAGDIIAEVETDKAVMEMESFEDGVMGQIFVQEGEKAQIGQKLALLLVKGEKAPSAEESKPAAPARADAPAAPEALKPAASAPAVPAPAAASDATETGGRVKASPLAKKIAAAKGVGLGSIQGTGPGGRVVAKDVEAAATRGPAPQAAPAKPAPVPAQPAAGDKRIPLSGMRKIIAERLLASKTQIPHFYLNMEVDAGEFTHFRALFNAAGEKAGLAKLTVNDFVLKAVVMAAARVPQVNASFAGDAVIQYGNVNPAVAVAIDDGLVTPVVRAAQTKSLREISEAVRDLAGRARTKKLKPDEYQGGTLTVTNLGSYGIENFSAIINPPQAIIISVGAIVKKPWVNAKDEIVVAQRMSIGLSADHRVVDGAIGAQFLAELRQLIENPAALLI